MNNPMFSNNVVRIILRSPSCLPRPVLGRPAQPATCRRPRAAPALIKTAGQRMAHSVRCGGGISFASCRRDHTGDQLAPVKEQRLGARPERSKVNEVHPPHRLAQRHVHHVCGAHMPCDVRHRRHERPHSTLFVGSSVRRTSIQREAAVHDGVEELEDGPRDRRLRIQQEREVVRRRPLRDAW